MAARAFNLACLISLFICAAVLVMWQRSYRGCDVLIAQRGPADRLTCSSEFGLIVLEVEGAQRGRVLAGWSYFEKPLPRRFRKQGLLLGFAGWRGTARHYLLLPSSPLWGVAIPYWFPFLAAGTLPAVWIARMRRRRAARLRAERGLCAKCGYDLRASNSRCPECGTSAGAV